MYVYNDDDTKLMLAQQAAREEGARIKKHYEDYIEMLEAKIPKWISVKDQLPESNQRVLFIDKHTDRLHAGQYRGQGGGDSSLFAAGNCLVTSNWWMPLPEYPEDYV